MLDVKYSTNVLKSLAKVRKRDPQLYAKVKVAIEVIREEPFAGERKKGDLKGIHSYDIRHNRTSYELAYMLQKNKDGQYIIVILFGTRENFYKELKRYLK